MCTYMARFDGNCTCRVGKVQNPKIKSYSVILFRSSRFSSIPDYSCLLLDSLSSYISVSVKLTPIYGLKLPSHAILLYVVRQTSLQQAQQDLACVLRTPANWVINKPKTNSLLQFILSRAKLCPWFSEKKGAKLTISLNSLELHPTSPVPLWRNQTLV